MLMSKFEAMHGRKNSNNMSGSPLEKPCMILSEEELVKVETAEYREWLPRPATSNPFQRNGFMKTNFPKAFQENKKFVDELHPTAMRFRESISSPTFKFSPDATLLERVKTMLENDTKSPKATNAEYVVENIAPFTPPYSMTRDEIAAANAAANKTN